MAETFETVDVILTAKHAEHINDRHVDRTQHLRTANFFLSLELSATLGLLLRRTWETRDGVELLDQGWRSGHGHVYLYTFDAGKFVGTDP